MGGRIYIFSAGEEVKKEKYDVAGFLFLFLHELLQVIISTPAVMVNFEIHERYAREEEEGGNDNKKNI